MKRFAWVPFVLFLFGPLLLGSNWLGAAPGTITGAFTSTATSVPATVGCADTALTVTNATVDKACFVSPHSNPVSAGGWSANCFASAAGTIQLHLCCVTANCTANSVTWTVDQ